VLRDHLDAHLLARSDWLPDDLVFGRSASQAFDPSSVRRRARAAWKAAKLEPITLHEARHSFASLGIASGVNAKALASYMGHSSIKVTYDTYGHLMPGNEAEAAGLFDAYLLRAGEGHMRGSPRLKPADRSEPERTGSSSRTVGAHEDSA
jgi:integrase